MDLLLALAGLVFVLGAWVHYFWTIASASVPRRPIVHALALVVGLALAVAGVFWGPIRGEGNSLVAILLLPISVGNVLLFFWLWSRAPLPDLEPNFAVGSPLPRIQAWNHRGEAFDSVNLAGERILLKFFRGHW